MADIQTKRLTRAQIAEWVGNNPRAIKLIEDLASDVGSTLPAYVQAAAMMALQSYLQPAVKPQPPSTDWQTLALGHALAPRVSQPGGIDWETALAAGLLSRPSGNTTINISGSGIGSSNITPDTHPAIPTAWDDEFESTSLDSKWIWANKGLSDAKNTQGALSFKIEGQTSTSPQEVRAIFQGVTGSSWKFRAKVSDVYFQPGWQSASGLIVRNSSTGKINSFGLLYSAGFSVYSSKADGVSGYTATATAGPTDVFTSSLYASPRSPLYLEIELSGGSIYFRYSRSGIEGSFVTFSSAFLTDHLVAVDQIGLYVLTTGNVYSISFFDWFRRIS